MVCNHQNKIRKCTLGPKLSSRCDLSLTDEQQTSKYINGLKYSIHERLSIQDVFSVDEAQNKAMKIERLQGRILPFNGAAEKASGCTRTQQGFTSCEQPLVRKAIDAQPANQVMATAPITKGKENPYVKPRVDKCYRCGEPEHRSNKRPKRRSVNIVDYEDEDEVLIETEPEDSDFVEEEREVAIYVVQQLLCNQKNPDTIRRHQIFYSRCSVKNKVCNLIIDNDICENIISTALVKYLKLETEPQPHPYTIGWIKNGSCIKVMNLCHVPISIDKFYKDSVTCDVVDMDTCHILLGRS